MNMKSVIGLYWDKKSQTHDENKYNSQNKVRHFRKGILNDAIRTDEHLKTLDVGTGTGFPDMLFAETGHNITGMNISGCTLEKARHNAGKLNLTVDFMHSDAENLRLHRFLCKIIAVITEKQSSRMFMSYYNDIRDQLPFFDGSGSDHIVDRFTKAGLKNIAVDNLEELKQFKNKNRSLAYQITNKQSLFLALGEK